jgi:hypothetical protein
MLNHKANKKEKDDKPGQPEKGGGRQQACHLEREEDPSQRKKRIRPL